MRDFEIEGNLYKNLKKIFKKDKKRYRIIFKKINEVVNYTNVDHYKNLRRPLQNFKRVHIDTNFVLIFKYDKNDDKIFFYDLDHHDNIYKK